MGDENTVLTEAEARHLLRRTEFEVKPSKVSSLAGKTRGAAVDKIIRGRGSRFRPHVRYNVDQSDLRREVHDSWVNYMIRTGRQLQEVMVLFWHDHFSCSNDTVADLVLTANQNQLLRRHCIGNVHDASFKDFVKAINKDGAMMDFLDTIRNSKGSPNENYARELQELFTLGVNDLLGVPNYTQDDIVQVARAFTGWRTHTDKGPGYKYGDAYLSSGRHDSGSPKTIYTTVGGFGPGGRDITENGTGEIEIDTVIDIIFEHRDSQGQSTVARFIANKLLAYLANPAPPLAVVDEVIAASNFDGSSNPAGAWQINPLLRAILVHDFFYSSAAQPHSVKWPAHYVISTLRQLKMRLAHTTFQRSINIDSDPANETVNVKRYHLLNDTNNGNSINHRLEDMGQLLFEPPSVFGWDWETAWVNSGTLLARNDFAVNVAEARGKGRTAFRPERLIDTGLTNPGAIVDAVTTVLQVPEQFPVASASRDALIDYLTDGGDPNALLVDGNGMPKLQDQSFRDIKLNGLFTLVLQSPAYQLQ